MLRPKKKSVKPQVTKFQKSVEDLLKASSLKVTKPRVEILSVLWKEHGPFSADDILTKVNTGGLGGSCDLVTVYRCLSKFEEAKIVNRCDFGDGIIRFELSHGDHHHHHLVCRVCQRVEVLEHCPFEPGFKPGATYGYKEISHRLEFFGICPACQS